MRPPKDKREGRLRLRHLMEQSEAAEVDMVESAPRFKALERRGPPRVVSSFNLFQTPEEIADRMAGLLLGTLSADSVVLEPSAGLGRLYKATRKRFPETHMVLVDSSRDCARELYSATSDDRNSTLTVSDFLALSPIACDAVIMNPPFQRGRDVSHIKHAYRGLRPGGLLVALCFDGRAQNKHLRPLATTWEPLGSVFRSEGTRAPVVLLTMERPE